MVSNKELFIDYGIQVGGDGGQKMKEVIQQKSKDDNVEVGGRKSNHSPQMHQELLQVKK